MPWLETTVSTSPKSGFVRVPTFGILLQARVPVDFSFEFQSAGVADICTCPAVECCSEGHFPQRHPVKPPVKPVNHRSKPEEGTVGANGPGSGLWERSWSWARLEDSHSLKSVTSELQLQVSFLQVGSNQARATPWNGPRRRRRCTCVFHPFARHVTSRSRTAARYMVRVVFA